MGSDVLSIQKAATESPFLDYGESGGEQVPVGLHTPVVMAVVSPVNPTVAPH